MDDPRPANTTVPVALSATGGRFAFRRGKIGSRRGVRRAVARDRASLHDRVHGNPVRVAQAMGDPLRALMPQPKSPRGRA